MAPPPAEELYTKLTSYWDGIKALKPDSPQSEYDKVLSYCTPDATSYFAGMGAPPSKGQAEFLASLKSLTQYWALLDRRIVTEAATSNGLTTTVIVEMDNRLRIMGEELDFPELEVVEFNGEGLIANYRLYCDPSPIRDIITRKMAEKKK
ncbi:hypothetical protein NA57DRAFT_77013 [Rhizodiscina lignyota]|uniref:SnoaL-like domain-containing protein n=1 Tax=Rhizodiscina lignyota TaxID=1504668 RepID=A0A9P4IHB7_9PEZI|nr:hypothetical protein NA57DRAFT_77013 [Rhizodiscina lignyota]